MKRGKTLLFSMAFVFLLVFLVEFVNATDYYVNATTGSNSNNGTSPVYPLKNLSGVQALVLVSGDRVLFERGQVWYDEKFSTSTIASNGVYVGAYGNGEKPLFVGTLNPLNITWEQNGGEWYYNRTSAPSYVFYSNTLLVLGTSDSVTANKYYWNSTSNRTYINLSKNPNGELIYIPTKSEAIKEQARTNLSYNDLSFIHFYTGPASPSGQVYILQGNNVSLNNINLTYYTDSVGLYLFISNKTSISNSYIYSNNTGASSELIYLRDVLNSTIINNTFLGGKAGINCNSNVLTPTKDTTISNNRFLNNSQLGISYSFLYNSMISNNYFESAYSGNAAMSGNPVNTTIFNNTINGSTGANWTTGINDGIKLIDYSGVKPSGNNISNNLISGVHDWAIYTTGNNDLFFNNTIEYAWDGHKYEDNDDDNGEANGQGTGMFLDEDSNNNSIIANVFRSCYQSITIDDASNVKKYGNNSFMFNRIYGTGINGIALHENNTYSVRLYRNTIVHTSNYSEGNGHALVYRGILGDDATGMNLVGNLFIVNTTLVGLEFISVDGLVNFSQPYHKWKSDYNLFWAYTTDASLRVINTGDLFNLQDWVNYFVNLATLNPASFIAYDENSYRINGTNPGQVSNFGNEDLTLTWNSTAIDKGYYDGNYSNILGMTNLNGGHIYGTPDIGAYEYQPPYTMGTDKINSSSVRIYADGKYRNLAENSTEINLTIVSQVGFNSSDYNQWMDLEIINWSTSGDYYKKWNETASNSSEITNHTIGDLEANWTYKLLVNENVSQNLTANETGFVNFTYTEGYSEKTFELLEFTTEEKCLFDGDFWYSSSCYADQQTACSSNGFVISGDSCVTPMAEDSSSGGSAPSKVVSLASIQGGETQTLAYGTKMIFSYKSENHTVWLRQINRDKAEIIIDVYSEKQNVSLAVGETKEIDLDSDGLKDYKISLLKIYDNLVKVDLKIEEIKSELVTQPIINETKEPVTNEEVKKDYSWIIYSVVVLVILGIGFFMWKKKH